HLGVSWEPPLDFPERLGRWPAAVLLLAFAALELAYVEPADPRTLALAIYLYSGITWLGMLAFGRRAWLENGDAFAVYFGLLSRLSPFAVREAEGERQIVIRPPLLSVSLRGAGPGALAFVAVMLGTVAFDGFSRTSWWIDRRYDVIISVGDSPQLAAAAATLFNVAGLVTLVVAVAVAYTLAVRAAERLSAQASLSSLFLASLVPISLAYLVAHYFSLLYYQAQAAIPLLSDPFGRGWDLFGTVGYLPNVGALSANLIWYVQVAALVVGHVVGLVLAHDRAVSLAGSPRLAVATQYPMLVLMVLYTVGGLWLLSAG
ncbi:MAG: fenitrothion hydrolase, partial [Gaiellaceae bacterium]